MSDDLADWVAEDMRRTTRRVGNMPPAAHAAWLDLTGAVQLPSRRLRV